MVRPAIPQPSADDIAIWSLGSRTVRQAVAETGLSRDELFVLMKEGVLRWKAKDLNGTRIIAWSDLVRYIASLSTTAPARPPRKPRRNGNARAQSQAR